MKGKTENIVHSALGAVLITLGAYVSFEIIPAVPFTLQIFSVFLITLVYKAKISLSAVVLYIIMGAVGFPVFSGAKGGALYIAGPTGGFLIGFLLFPLAMFIFRENRLSLIPAFVFFYIFGILWLSWYLKISIKDSMLSVWIFIPLDIIKLILAYYVSGRVKKIIR